MQGRRQRQEAGGRALLRPEGQQVAAGSPFWGAVGEEARATWRGRFGRLWLLLAIGLEAVFGFGPQPAITLSFFDNPLWIGLCLLAAWVPAWLGADLLSLRFRCNPEPHREWHPTEFLARAVGRLAPYFAAEVVWASTLAGRTLLTDLIAGRGSHSWVTDWYALPSAWSGWVLAFLASGTFCAAWAALFSASARRPRRCVLVPTLMLLVLLADLTGMSVFFQNMKIGTSSSSARARTVIAPPDLPYSKDSLLFVLRISGTPNLWLGNGSASELLSRVGPLLGQASTSDWEFGVICWAASAALLGYAIPPFLATWWIADRRWRRHPNRAQANSGTLTNRPIS